MKKEKNIFMNDKAITLIALAVTIVILLILAGTSVSMVVGNNGIIGKAKEAAFKTEVSQYKWEFEQQKLLQLLGKEESVYVSDIYGLKEGIQKQIDSLDRGTYNANNGISLVQTTDGALIEMYGALQRVRELLVQMSNETNTQEEIDMMRNEIDQIVDEIKRMTQGTWFDDVIVLNGFSYTVELGDGYLDQGNIEITLDKVDFKSLYGSETIDYTNIAEALEKNWTAIQKLSNIRAYMGAMQNRLDYAKECQTNLSENIANMQSNIFNSDNEQQTVKNAESWNTTVSFIDIAYDTLSNIEDILNRVKELSMREDADQNTRREVQPEIDELIKEIDRILKYTRVVDKKVFDGSFPYVNYLDIKVLGIKDISIVEDASDAETRVESALATIGTMKTSLQNKKTELSTMLNEEADKGFAFDVTDNSDMYDEVNNQIDKKYSDKIRVINGKLTYIGDDANEKTWAQEIGIECLN